MTYKNLLFWILDEDPPQLHDTLYQWLGSVKTEFSDSGHFFPDDTRKEMEKYWIKGKYGPIGEPNRRTEKHNYDRVYNSLIEKNTFKLSEAYEASKSRRGNYKDIKSFRGGIRRDIQKLVKQRLLERIGKGEYRISV